MRQRINNKAKRTLAKAPEMYPTKCAFVILGKTADRADREQTQGESDTEDLPVLNVSSGTVVLLSTGKD